MGKDLEKEYFHRYMKRFNADEIMLKVRHCADLTRLLAKLEIISANRHFGFDTYGWVYSFHYNLNQQIGEEYGEKASDSVRSE